MKKVFLYSMFFLYPLLSLNTQEDDKEKIEAETISNNITSQANHQISRKKFEEAEANYRRAISKNQENITAKYNLGNAYYNNESYEEAFDRYKQAGETEVQKNQKHKAFHNMGNVFMQRKEYKKAVEAYKQALRNNPEDDETRYNLALAKKMLEKEEQAGGGDDKDNKKDQENNKDNQGEGDNKKEDNNSNQQNNSNQDNKQGEQNPDAEQKNNPEEDNNQDNQGGQSNNKPPKEEKEGQQPRQSQLSPQQVRALLEAMNNEEKKVQEKLNAKKVKGGVKKKEKDW